MAITFSDPAVPGVLDSPKGDYIRGPIGQDLGPVAIGDLGSGLSAFTWFATVEDDGVYINRDGDAATLLFAQVGVGALDLTFDSAGYPVVAYELAGDVLVYWYDGGYTSDNLGAAVEPCAARDIDDEAFVAYRVGSGASYVLRSGDFATEYDAPLAFEISALTAIGFSTAVNRFVFNGRPPLTAPVSTVNGSGTVVSPSATPPVAPFEPVPERIFFHLLPRGRAWALSIAKQLRQFIRGISIPLISNTKLAADVAFLDVLPQYTSRLADWEEQWGLTNQGLSEQARRDRLAATWAATGSLSPHYLQNLLQDQGFDVYVHDWWVPGTEPAVGVEACATARDPFTYLVDLGASNTSETQCGEALAQCGEATALCGYLSGAVGYPLSNKVVATQRDFLIACGEALAQCGEATALCGQYSALTDRDILYPLPADPDKWPYFVYIGGATFPDGAVVDSQRREEFERLLLKYCPAHMWIGVLVSYT